MPVVNSVSRAQHRVSSASRLMAGLAAFKHEPAERQQAGWNVGRHRHHTFAREPRCAPLREGTPGTLRSAKVCCRGEQAYRDEEKGQPECSEGKPTLCRRDSQQARNRKPGQQTVARAGGGGEDDDGVGRMHEVRRLAKPAGRLLRRDLRATSRRWGEVPTPIETRWRHAGGLQPPRASCRARGKQ